MPWQQILIEILSKDIFKLGSLSINLGWLISIFCLLIITTLLSNFLKRLLKNRILKGLGLPEGSREAISTLSSLIAGAIAYIVILQIMGLNLTSIAVLLGGLSVGIGLALQELSKNLISGLTLLVEQKLKVGDFIEFQKTKGHIKEISFRFTTIRTLNGSELIVPNTILTSNLVENWHYTQAKNRLTLAVNVSAGSDPLLVTEILLRSAYMEPAVLHEPPPKVIFTSFGEDSLNFELWAWCSEIEQAISVKSSIYFLIEYNLRSEGLNISRPEREIWVKSIDDRSKGDERPQIGYQSSPVFKMLREVSYFQDFNELQLRFLIEKGFRKHLNDGEILFHKGESAHFFCIVLQGRVDAIYEIEKISRQIFTFNQGQYFGELPLMLEVPYPTTMIARGETILFMLNTQGFRLLLTTYPEIAQNIAVELANRQEEISSYEQQLKEMGLWDEERFKNPVLWIKDCWKKLFHLG
ncbi:MAG: hypothetical protein N5P05_001554 [Chroococcopsis gigantea SAG 12.99]|jgi:potassium efflux system protein|nr:mechanosensitive ion channel [Chlorogloea purpurea SAG 13.99]MDV2999948.1 hypothetical protein [Chroococcopsis gigantea SAG 12.99]